jgi:hypothetical protein
VSLSRARCACLGVHVLLTTALLLSALLLLLYGTHTHLRSAAVGTAAVVVRHTHTHLHRPCPSTTAGCVTGDPPALHAPTPSPARGRWPECTGTMTAVSTAAYADLPGCRSSFDACVPLSKLFSPRMPLGPGMARLLCQRTCKPDPAYRLCCSLISFSPTNMQTALLARLPRAGQP